MIFLNISFDNGTVTVLTIDFADEGGVFAPGDRAGVNLPPLQAPVEHGLRTCAADIAVSGGRHDAGAFSPVNAGGGDGTQDRQRADDALRRRGRRGERGQRDSRRQE